MRTLSIVSLLAFVACFGACTRHSAESTEHFRIMQLPKAEQEAYHKEHGNSHGAAESHEGASADHEAH